MDLSIRRNKITVRSKATSVLRYLWSCVPGHRSEEPRPGHCTRDLCIFGHLPQFVGYINVNRCIKCSMDFDDLRLSPARSTPDHPSCKPLPGLVPCTSSARPLILKPRLVRGLLTDIFRGKSCGLPLQSASQAPPPPADALQPPKPLTLP